MTDLNHYIDEWIDNNKVSMIISTLRSIKGKMIGSISRLPWIIAPKVFRWESPNESGYSASLQEAKEACQASLLKIGYIHGKQFKAMV